MSNTRKHKAVELFEWEIEKLIMDSNDVSIFFDHNLCYKIVNDAACEHLHKKAKDLLNKNILDLFPEIVASANHRNLLRALDGQTLRNISVPDRNGNFFKCTYKPIYLKGELLGVLVTSIDLKREDQ